MLFVNSLILGKLLELFFSLLIYKIKIIYHEVCLGNNKIYVQVYASHIVTMSILLLGILIGNTDTLNFSLLMIPSQLPPFSFTS